MVSSIAMSAERVMEDVSLQNTESVAHSRVALAHTAHCCFERCLIWVISAVLTVGPLLPVYPDKQTFVASVGMSQRCQWTKPLAR
jgi:hypothetical protein